MKKDAIIWTQLNCKYCMLAKEHLLKNGYTYTEKVIGGNYTKKQLLDEVPSARSVPQIFINGSYIGDYNDLIKAV